MLRWSILTCAFMVGVPALASPEEAGQSERRISGVRHLEPVEAVKGSAAYGYGQSIGRLEQVDPGTDNGIGYCTAVHVGEHLFMTSAHCLLRCEQMNIRLGYEQGLDRSGQQIYRCKAVVTTNSSLDYALIEAVPALDAQDMTREVALSFPTMPLYAGELHDQQAVWAIGQASGGFKEIDRSSTCTLSTVAVAVKNGRDSIKHGCATLRGSSGTPLIDRDHGYGVALHWGDQAAIPMALIVSDMQTNLAPDQLSQLTIEP